MGNAQDALASPVRTDPPAPVPAAERHTRSEVVPGQSPSADKTARRRSQTAVDLASGPADGPVGVDATGGSERPPPAQTRSLHAQLTGMFRLLIVSGVALTLLLTGWLGWMLIASQPRIDALHRATGLIADTDRQLQTAQSDLRAYLATGDSTYLASYRGGVPALADRNAQLGAVAGGLASGPLVAFEVAVEQWTSQWADRVTEGTLSTGAQPGHPADPLQLGEVLAAGRTLFTAYALDEQALTGALQRQLDASRSEQRTATELAAALALLLSVGTAAVGVRRQRRLKSSVGAPMVEIGRAVGALVRGDYDAVRITPAGPTELFQLCTLVLKLTDRLAARRTENDAARALEARRMERTEVILAAAREIAGSLNLRYVLEAVAGAAATLCEATGARLWLVETPGAPLLLSFDTAYGRAGIREQVELDLGSGVAGRAAKYGRPARGEGAEVVDGVPTVAVPLIVGARVVGALECSGGDRRELTDEVLKSLETLATHAAAAIEASRLHQAAEEMSVTDALTGLANRRQLDRDLPAEVERATRYGRPLTVLFGDLDHFKQLNDRYGHSYGDLVLQQVGQVFAGELRKVDIAYRIGGEEFVVVAPEATLEEGRALAERLREAVRRATSQSGTTGGVTASFGVATLPEHGNSGPTLLAAADAALYGAKENGRDQVRVATSTAGVLDQRQPYALPPVVGRPTLQVPQSD